MKGFINKKGMVATLLIGAMVAAVGCTSKSSSGGGDSTAAALGISGTLNLSTSSRSLSKNSRAMSDEDQFVQSTDLTQYTVVCATTSAPILSGTGTVAADGTFSVSIEGAADQPLSCYLVDANDEKAADFLISDSSKTDLNGNSSMTTSAAFSEDVAMGDINFDPNSGEVVVPTANLGTSIVSTAPSADSVFDPTGAWTIGAVDFTLPKGVLPPCDQERDGNECHGPPNGQQLYLKMWSGTKTADSSGMYGLQVWNSVDGFNSCGGKIGLTTQMKTEIGVDFSANGSADAPFAFATSIPSFEDQISNTTGTVTLTDYWKMDTAETQWNLNPSCSPRDITAGSTTYVNAWVCGPDNSSRYQASLGGGCTKTVGGAPVNVQDWTGMSCPSSTTDSDGVSTQTCTGTATVNGVATAVTCSNKWAVTNASYAVQSGASFNWNDLTANEISSGTLCSAIANGASSEALKIAQAQCYSNYYNQSGMYNASACLPRVDMDWSATTAAEFVKVDLIRPNELVFFEEYRPFPDGNGGSIVTRQEHYNGVQVNGNSWVNCRVVETGGLTLKKISDTKLLATYQSSEITTSQNKPACRAAFTGQKKTFFFYLTK